MLDQSVQCGNLPDSKTRMPLSRFVLRSCVCLFHYLGVILMRKMTFEHPESGYIVSKVSLVVPFAQAPHISQHTLIMTSKPSNLA